LTDEPLGDILAALSASPFVHEPKVEIDDRDEVKFIRADVYFIDNPLLHFRELWIWQEGHRLKKAYTYHYQRADGTMVFRYDKGPHFPNLASSPHHKHIGEKDVVATDAPDLQAVL
jgi:hypothetical protein